MNSTLIARYQTLVRSPDPATRRLAAAQLRRLRQPPVARLRSAEGRASRWGHVPVADLFAAQGNNLHPRKSGRIDAGHEPVHASKSGRCVSIDPVRGLWYCRSCRRGGDAATYLMQIHGWTYHQTADELRQRYGTRERPVLRVEVS